MPKNARFEAPKKAIELRKMHFFWGWFCLATSSNKLNNATACGSVKVSPLGAVHGGDGPRECFKQLFETLQLVLRIHWTAWTAANLEKHHETSSTFPQCCQRHLLSRYDSFRQAAPEWWRGQGQSARWTASLSHAPVRSLHHEKQQPTAPRPNPWETPQWRTSWMITWDTTILRNHYVTAFPNLMQQIMFEPSAG